MLTNDTAKLENLVNEGLAHGRAVVKVCPIGLIRTSFYLNLTPQYTKNYKEVVDFCENHIKNRFKFELPYIIAEVNNTRL